MPRLIPVLDLLGGRAVHARGGRRADYRPIASRLRPGSDPLVLAAATRDDFGLTSLYLADLDAIAGGLPSLALYRDLAGLGLTTWVDAGLRDSGQVGALLDAGVGRVVVGLETIAGPEALGRVVQTAGRDRVAFSLDLRDGRAIVAAGADWGDADPARIAARAVGLGVGTVILLDLARVGAGRGVGTLPLLGEVRAACPGVDWVVGGGVSKPADLADLDRAGASAILIGSALHDGRVAPPRPIWRVPEQPVG